MARPRKEESETRVRLNVSLARETAGVLKELSTQTYIPMSNLLDMFIAEYVRNNEEELKKKGIVLNGK